MDIKLIALDIDGTLTDDNKEIPENTREKLIALEREGIRLALASARPTPGLFKSRDILNMQEYGGILMAYNGGRITDTNGNTLAETRIDMETARKILQLLKKQPVTVILDDGKRIYAEDANGYKVAYECRNNEMECEVHSDLASFLNFAPFKFLLAVDPEKILDIQTAIASELPENLKVVRTAAFYLEIIPKSVNKGKALLQICASADIDAGETIAFGDTECDIPLLRAAGVGVAMGNAETAVKENADFTTKSNNENGIVYALNQIAQS